jgi:hypothetical protein
MNGSFQIKAADKMDAVLTLTGPVGDFRALAKHIRAMVPDGDLVAWPVCNLLRQIDDMVRMAEKSFFAASEEEPRR